MGPVSFAAVGFKISGRCSLPSLSRREWSRDDGPLLLLEGVLFLVVLARLNSFNIHHKRVLCCM
jgi:hypothetical protein